MTIELVLAIVQVVGTIAVVASVVALVIEIRSSTRANRMQAYTLASGDMKQFIADMKRDPEILALYRNGLRDFKNLSAEDRWRFGTLMQELMWIYHGWWVLRDDLPMAEDQIAANIHGMISRPGMSQWWEKGRHVMPQDFVAYIDELLRQEYRQSGTAIGMAGMNKDELIEALDGRASEREAP